jgi:hypothetical protein
MFVVQSLSRMAFLYNVVVFIGQLFAPFILLCNISDVQLSVHKPQ